MKADGQRQNGEAHFISNARLEGLTRSLPQPSPQRELFFCPISVFIFVHPCLSLVNPAVSQLEF